MYHVEGVDTPPLNTRSVHSNAHLTFSVRCLIGVSNFLLKYFPSFLISVNSIHISPVTQTRNLSHHEVFLFLMKFSTIPSNHIPSLATFLHLRCHCPNPSYHYFSYHLNQKFLNGFSISVIHYSLINQSDL